MHKNKEFYKTEIIAGITSFLTMAYIAFVNPLILQEAGMDPGAVFTATCLITCFACALIGFIAKAPIGVAPGMALNVYFTYGVVLEFGFSWQQGLGMVFISGFLFLLICFTPFKRLLIDAIPKNLQIAILVGISLLIALIALENNGIIVRGNHSLLHLGNVMRAESLLFFLGFLIILVLDHHAIKGSIIIGILSISLLSLLLGLTSWHGLFALPPSLSPILFKLDFTNFSNVAALKAIFAFFLIALFDAAGTLLGLFSQPILKKIDNPKKKIEHSLTIDAAASTLAGLIGSASTSPYIESAAGIEAGGRTGIVALVIAAGFLLMLLFYPLAQSIPSFASGPALLFVATAMIKSVVEFDFTKNLEVAPSMLTIILIPFTTSIADGIGAGIILLTLLRMLAGRKVNPVLLILSLIFIVFFILS